MRFVLLAILSTVVGSAIGCAQNCDEVVRRRNTAPDETQRRQTVRVAGIVLKWITAEKELNYERAEPMIREAADRGAELVITTECFLDGYAIRDKEIPLDEWRAMGEVIPGGAYLKRLQALAAELNIWLVAGMMERDGETTHNTAVLINRKGELVGRYRKQHLGHESPRNTEGNACPVFETPFGKVGMMICADRRYPETIKAYGEGGADLMICPSGGMWGPIKNDYHVQARSRENDFPVVFVHPIEFLVTGRDGAILDRRFTGQDMSLDVDQIDGPRDMRRVAMFDLTLK